ncbi:MAG: gliding motility-associated C-terminal domain-containing protein [Prevotellaceae bacterium]|jgi:hypothetical protein|nr:gliding motility-associated C-terminal domain-containing protein [Prevotellaceae bacterium]
MKTILKILIIMLFFSFGEKIYAQAQITDTDLPYFHNHEDAAFSQISLSKIIAEKTYPDNTKIVYFEINNLLSNLENAVMEQELIKNQNILRFKKIPSQTGVQYLFEANHSFSADSVVFYMNNVLMNMKKDGYADSQTEESGTVLPPPSVSDMRDGCIDAAPFCTSNQYRFPAATDVTDLGHLGCCLKTPNPAWYWMEINDPGVLEITITSDWDVDFVAWGPFTDLNDACQNFLPTCPVGCPNNTDVDANYPYGNIVDCSYDPLDFEVCHINNAQNGEIYLLLITNFSNRVTDIRFLQTGGDASTNCGIVTPPVTNNGPLCEGDSLQLMVTNPVAGAIYNWTGPNGWTSTQQNPVIYNVTVADAGTYTLIISVDNEIGEEETTDVMISTYPVAAISASSSTVTCSQPVILTASGGVTYSWSNGSAVVGNSAELVVTAAETYTVTVTNDGGCSDTASITINIDTASYRFVDINTICSDLAPYIWRSNLYYTTGIYYDNMTALNGCDSIFILNLTVNPAYHDTINATICLGETYTGYNFNESPAQPGYFTFVHSETTILGCDSITTLNLTVNPVYDDTIYTEICAGECYTENNFNICTDGAITIIQSKSYQTTSGCDSIVTLHLVAHPSYNDTVNTTICLGETYIDDHFNESPAQSGYFTFVRNETTALGCDSIFTLNMTVNPAYEEYIYGSIYEDEFYRVGDYKYNTPGLHISNLQTDKNCDSIINLYLDVIYYPYEITAFSPFNKDGVNDYFMAGFKVQIFNRYGAIIYETKTEEEQALGWDGKNTKKQNVEPGLYFYILYNSSGKPRIKSSVEVLKK